jgi:hypothetical protein
MEHEELLVFAFLAHTRPSNAPTALVSRYLEAVFTQALNLFPARSLLGYARRKYLAGKRLATAE